MADQIKCIDCGFLNSFDTDIADIIEILLTGGLMTGLSSRWCLPPDMRKG